MKREEGVPWAGYIRDPGVLRPLTTSSWSYSPGPGPTTKTLTTCEVGNTENTTYSQRLRLYRPPDPRDSDVESTPVVS